MQLLRDTNRVLFAKLVWKWLKNPKALRVKILKVMLVVGKGLRVVLS